QPLAYAEDPAYRNSLTSMRPQTTASELPSSHDISTYVHNEFVSLLNQFKTEFEVRFYRVFCFV
ncbi:hypothetical protein SISNIDRAFT_419439, partial [Sistotremastrum niveocremeum HHB9708]